VTLSSELSLTLQSSEQLALSMLSDTSYHDSLEWTKEQLFSCNDLKVPVDYEEMAGLRS
jgi:hypothetical protein